MLSNDTASVTLVSLGEGDDAIVVGTVPLKPDPGNRTLEFPEGVPVVDLDNLTNGNSNLLFMLGERGNDNFEVNFNRAQLYLHGGQGDDRFLLKTFLVLREDADDPDEITNLAKVFGGEGSNRYEYLQNGPVAINGGPGTDTLVIVGTPIGDVFVVTSTVIAGAGRIVNFRGIEAVEIDGGGGDDQIYVLSTDDQFTLTINGGSGDDVIHLGGDHPPLVFDPPPFTYQPPAIQVQLPPTLVFVPETRSFGDFSIEINADFWSTLIFRLFFGISTGSLIQQAQRVLEDTVNSWFESWKRTQPNIRDAHVAYDRIAIQRITTSYFFGLVHDHEVPDQHRQPARHVRARRAQAGVGADPAGAGHGRPAAVRVQAAADVHARGHPGSRHRRGRRRVRDGRRQAPRAQRRRPCRERPADEPRACPGWSRSARTRTARRSTRPIRRASSTATSRSRASASTSRSRASPGATP